MIFWIREVVGWVCVILGLLVFYICILLLVSGHVFQGGPLSVIGIILFRGGIHLLKVAVAARICLHAQRQAEPPRRSDSRAIRGEFAGPPSSMVRALPASSTGDKT
jgi:hypothetical protein